MVDALNMRVQINHVATMSSYGTDHEERIGNAGKKDEKYQQLKEKSQKNL